MKQVWVTEIIGINYLEYCNDVVDVNIRYKDVKKERTVQLTLTKRALKKLIEKLNGINLNPK